MKTLNKTLSLVLVLVMVLGLFGVASAADFKDKAEIENVEAVNTMAALNIINGKNGNVFDPTGTVTRAEMSKMICVALNGGKEPVLGTTANPTYSDIQGHWAAGYIEYCSTLGIVAGMGDGTFAPDATVTGSQAAKMMLVAMNYKADVFGFTGPAWETRVNVEANKAGLYDDLGGLNASEGLSRDNAAQLIYNGINAGMMQLSWQQNANGEITQTYQLNTGKTIATEKFGLNTGYSYIANVEYDSVDKQYKTDIEDPKGIPATTADFDTDFRGDVDYSAYVGMNVKILYKTTTTGIHVYGVYPYKSNVVLSGVVGQLSDSDIVTALSGDELKFNNTTYKFETAIGATPVYNFNETAARGTMSAFLTSILGGNTILAAYTFKAIDLDNDGKIDNVVVYPFSVYKVTYVGAEKATITQIDGEEAALTEIDLKEDSTYDGIAKGDYVKYTAAGNNSGNTNVFEKIMPMTGTVTKTTTAALGSVTLTKAQMNGIYFVDLTGSTQTIGTSYENIIQVNTFVFYSDVAATSTAGEDYAVCIKAVSADSYGTAHAKLLFSDGTVKEVATAADYSSTFMTETLVEFTVSAVNGKYTLATATKVPGAYDNNEGGAFVGDATNGAKIGGKAIDDNAIVFVKTAANDYKVVTGAQAKAYSGTVTNNAAFYTTNQSTGFKTIRLAFITLNADVISGDTNYGYVTADIATTKNEKNVTVYEVTFWNGTEEVTKVAASKGTLAKGVIFSYTYNDDGYMVTDEVAGLKVGKVTGFDGTAIDISDGQNTAKKVTDKTTVFYVNGDTYKGVAGGEIQLSDGTNNNIYYVDNTNATDPLKFVLFDTRNKVSALTNASVSATEADTAAKLNALFDVYSVVTVDDDWTAPAAAYTVPAGKTLVVTGTTTLTANAFTVNGTFKTGVIADTNIAQLAIGAKGTLNITGAAASTAVVTQLEAITTAGAKVTFATATTSVAANKWYTTKGTAQTATGNDGTVASAVGATTEIPAGTYTYGQLGFGANNLDDPNLTAWFKA